MFCKLLGHKLEQRWLRCQDGTVVVVVKCRSCSYTKSEVLPALPAPKHASQLADVREFMLAAEQIVPTQANLPDVAIRRLRVGLIAEELLELAKASNVYFRYAVEDSFEQSYTIPNEPNIVDAADAFADLLYVVLGGAIAWGINLDAVFAEVHASNMTKFVDGHKRDDGKWQKGPSYRPADIASIVNAQLD